MGNSNQRPDGWSAIRRWGYCPLLLTEYRPRILATACPQPLLFPPGRPSGQRQPRSPSTSPGAAANIVLGERPAALSLKKAEAAKRQRKGLDRSANGWAGSARVCGPMAASLVVMGSTTLSSSLIALAPQTRRFTLPIHSQSALAARRGIRATSSSHDPGKGFLRPDGLCSRSSDAYGVLLSPAAYPTPSWAKWKGAGLMNGVLIVPHVFSSHGILLSRAYLAQSSFYFPSRFTPVHSP